MTNVISMIAIVHDKKHHRNDKCYFYDRGIKVKYLINRHLGTNDSEISVAGIQKNTPLIMMIEEHSKKESLLD